MKRAQFFLRPTALLFTSLALLFALAPIKGLAQSKSADEDYALTELEKAVLEEMNLARTDPVRYATYLEAWRNYYNGKRFKQPGTAPVDTAEGISALEEAIKYLRSSKPLPPLQVSKGMCLGAKDQSFDQSQASAISHQGKDKSFSWNRVARYGEWKAPVSENIAYDSGTARDLVINLIIDDGIPSRGHRNNIFNSSYIVTGISCGNHPLYGGICVCTFAGGFTEKSASPNKSTQSQPAQTQPSAPKARKL
jgi:uncharacterized protein YkwD